MTGVTELFIGSNRKAADAKPLFIAPDQAKLNYPINVCTAERKGPD